MSASITELLNTNADSVKTEINASFDGIIQILNVRREQLLDQIDVVTQHKVNKALHNTRQNLTTSIVNPSNSIKNTSNKTLHESINTQIDIDLDFVHLHKILYNIGNIKEYEEPKYIKKVRHGLEGDELLLSGYIRNITKYITSIKVNTDVDGICFNYYSSNAHLSQHEKDIFKMDEEKYDVICKKFKEALGNKVEDVFVDDVDNRKCDFPLRVIDHALNENLKREATKVSLAINPSHIIISTLLEREWMDGDDKTFKRIVLLLYDISLTAADLPLFDRTSLHHGVCRLIKLGLAIFSDSSSSEEEPEEID